ncbi:MAG: DUF177 domain-containing protein [Nocardioidaceae bacterium]|nr:DUF177 domain-containing protein [Nocardioidaceae bacterium]
MLDTRELGRRPGAQRQVSWIEPAPAGLGIDMLHVPPGSDLELELRLEAVMEGVLVTGTARAQVAGECVRCLLPVEDGVVVDLQELFVYDPTEVDDDDVSRLEGDLLDLESVVRDAVVLALPFNPVCEPDCAGLCPTCGARLADEPAHGHDEQIDPRWSALRQLVGPTDERRPAHMAGLDEE